VFIFHGFQTITIDSKAHMVPIESTNDRKLNQMHTHTHTPSHKWCGSFQLPKQSKSNSINSTLDAPKH